MKIFGVAIFAALSTIVYSEGSEAKEPSQLIAKKSGGEVLKPENALVNFVHSRGEYSIGGGALLTAKSVIAPYSIFSRYKGVSSISGLSDFVIVNCYVSVGLNPFVSRQRNYEHAIINLKHNVQPNCAQKKAIVLVTIDPKSSGDFTLPPQWVQHIPIASRSYTPGLHSISESVAAWNAKLYMRNIPISRVLVDENGTMFTHIDMADGEQESSHSYSYWGGIITRGGILAGLIFKQKRTEDTPPKIALYCLPVDGTNKLIENWEDKQIRIIDLDSGASSSRGP